MKEKDCNEEYSELKNVVESIAEQHLTQYFLNGCGSYTHSDILATLTAIK
jgi:hypothetical protein